MVLFFDGFGDICHRYLGDDHSPELITGVAEDTSDFVIVVERCGDCINHSCPYVVEALFGVCIPIRDVV